MRKRIVELREKLMEADLQVEEKKELMCHLIEEGLRYVFTYSTDALKFLIEDEAYMLKLIVDLIVTNERALEMKRVLLSDDYEEQLDAYAIRMHRETEDLYRRYFESKCEIRNKHLYSQILRMYWDPKHGIWISKDKDGTIRFTAYMPVEKGSIN